MHLPKLILITMATAMLIFHSSGANASTFTFTDSYIAFPGYPSYTPWTKPSNPSVDEYGNPKIASMTVTVDSANRLIQNITFDLKESGIIRWDNLFINTSYVALPGPGSAVSNWDQSWDYIVHSGGATAQSFSNNSNRIWGNIWTKNGLYGIETPPENYLGFYTTVTGTRWDGTTYSSTTAEGHPDGIESKYVNQSEIKGKDRKTITGNNTKDPKKIIYDFTSLTIGSISGGIPYNDGFTIGYTPWCANDVFLASYSQPVPEPATLLLFGSGIVGLAGLRLRRKAQAD